MSFNFKDYKINHIALLFIKVLTFSQKQVKIQNSVPSIGRTYYSIDQQMKKFIIKLLPRSIDSRFLFDRSKSTFNWLKGILNRSRQWRISSWSFCLNRLVLDSSSIDRMFFSIDRKEFSIDRNSHNWICFQNFPGTVFDIFIVFYQNTFWFYQWRFIDQTLGFSISRSRTIIMLETLKT